MKKVFHFGKINFYGAKKINDVTIEVELNDEDVFTACGYVWNIRHTDCVSGGQNLDELFPFFNNNNTFKEIYRFWKLYHLNDLHAGTKEQEKAVNEKFGNANANDYEKHVDYLKSINMYEVEYNGKPYLYGHGWIKYDIPTDD